MFNKLTFWFKQKKVKKTKTVKKAVQFLNPYLFDPLNTTTKIPYEFLLLYERGPPIACVGGRKKSIKSQDIWY